MTIEPLLFMDGDLGCECCGECRSDGRTGELSYGHWLDPLNGGIDWVIVGGESGKGARPMHPDWVRSIRDQCLAAGVPFFFKQWGGHRPMASGEMWKRSYVTVEARKECGYYCEPGPDGGGHYDHGVTAMIPCPKKKAGRTLDGRTWDQMPEVKR
jgi:hypothetical protein